VLVEYGVILVVALAAAFLIQAYVVKPYRIPTQSMMPTIDPHDRILVARFLYHFTPPARGDIVVFKYPLDTHVVFIKRLIALPGDTVSLRGGFVYVNGVRQNASHVLRFAGRPVPTEPGPSVSNPWSLDRPYTVPAGHYFMMGDNRTDSDDSRFWGPVPASDLIGRAFFTYWPITRLGLP
jgi:signal peptidase I